MKKNNYIIALLIFSSFSFNLFACETKKLGVFSNFIDNTCHAGDFSGFQINISCKDNKYSAVLVCAKIISDSFFSKNLNDYFVVSKVIMTNDKDNVSFIVSDKIKQKCGLDDLHGQYRFFDNGSDISLSKVGSSLDKKKKGLLEF